MVGGARVEDTMPKWSSSISGEGTSTTGGPAGGEGEGEGRRERRGECGVCMQAKGGMVGIEGVLVGE